MVAVSTPWLTTLKKPKRSQASTIARAALGMDRSTTGTAAKVSVGPGERRSGIWSTAGGLASTTMAVSGLERHASVRVEAEEARTMGDECRVEVVSPEGPGRGPPG
nr:unnamed protein product [Digitaria exilis]